MPDNPITEDNREYIYTANEGQTDFVVSFKFQQNDDLEFGLLDDQDAFTALVLGVDYTVSGAESDNGGTITLLVPAGAGKRFRVRGEATLEMNKRFTGARYAKDVANSLFERSLIWIVEMARDVGLVKSAYDELNDVFKPEITAIKDEAQGYATQTAEDRAQTSEDRGFVEWLLSTTALRLAQDRTELKAVDSSKIKLVRLFEAGRDGWFNIYSNGYDNEITADTGEGIYIRLNDGGAAVRRVNGNRYYANWFGAVLGDSAANAQAFMDATKIASGDYIISAYPGAYGLTERIDVVNQQRTDIIANGVTLYPVDGISENEPLIQFWINSALCHVEGILFDGKDIIRFGVIARSDYPSIKKCEFTRCGTDRGGHGQKGAGIYCSGEEQPEERPWIYGARITSCRFFDCMGAGIAQWSSLKAIISDVQFERMGFEAITCDRPSSDFLIVTDFVADTTCKYAGVGAIGIDGGQGWQISDGVILNTLHGLESDLDVPGICVQNNLGDSADGKISGMTISGCLDGAMLFKTTGANAAGDGGTTVNVTVEGSTMFDNNGKSIVAEPGTTGALLGNNYGGDEPDVPAEWQRSDMSFKVRLTNQLDNVTGDGSWYTIPYNQVVRDPAGCMSNGVFTAPRNGTFFFNNPSNPRNIAGDHTYGEQRLLTSSGEDDRRRLVACMDGTHSAHVNGSYKLLKGQTVQAQIRVGGGANTKQVSFDASDGSFNYLEAWMIEEST